MKPSRDNVQPPDDDKRPSYVHYDVKSSIGSNGKWSIVVIILAVLHVVTFTWMINLENENKALSAEVRELRIRRSNEDVFAWSEGVENVRDKRAQAGKMCERFRRRVARCQSPKAPLFARQQGAGERDLIQLYGYGDQETIGIYEIVKNWKVDVKTGGNGLMYSNGYIKIKKKGYYYIYAQMTPAKFSIEKEWQFEIMHVEDDKSISIASLSLPGCGKNCSKTTMFTSRIVHLTDKGSLAIRVKKGKEWFSTSQLQIFGAYFLGSSQ